MVKLWGYHLDEFHKRPHCDVIGIMVGKRNHPKVALLDLFSGQGIIKIQPYIHIIYTYIHIIYTYIHIIYTYIHIYI